MRRIAFLLAAALVASLLVVPSASAGKGGLKTLGTDPELDAPPALDITNLQVGRAGKNLEIRIGVANMFPVVSGYPALPGIEWTFSVGSRTFIAEGVADVGGPAFYLFEERNGSFTQLESPAGTYDSADGFIKMLVPLKTIGARSGSHVVGTTLDGVPGDVDAHIHAGPQTYYADSMETTKHYSVP
jgi:hypothetical protein